MKLNAIVEDEAWRVATFERMSRIFGLSYLVLTVLRWNDSFPFYLVLSNFFFGLFFWNFNQLAKRLPVILNYGPVILGSYFLIEVFLSFIAIPHLFLAHLFWMLILPLVGVAFLDSIYKVISVIIPLAAGIYFSFKYSHLPFGILLQQQTYILPLFILLTWVLVLLGSIIKERIDHLFQNINLALKSLNELLVQRVLNDNLRVALATVNSLRHEINNPSGVVALSLYLLKKRTELASSILELETIVFSIRERLSRLEVQELKEETHLKSKEILAEIEQMENAIGEAARRKNVTFIFGVGALLNLLIFIFNLVHYPESPFRLLIILCFGLICGMGFYLTPKVRSVEKAHWVLAISTYVYTAIRSVLDGGLLYSGLIWIIAIPFIISVAFRVRAGFWSAIITSLYMILISIFIEGQGEYVLNSTAKIVNFAFIVVVIFGVTNLVTQRRKSFYNATEDAVKWLQLQILANGSESQAKSYQKMVFSLIEELEPQIHRAREIALDLRALHDDKVIDNVVNSLDRIDAIFLRLRSLDARSLKTKLMAGDREFLIID